MKWFKHDTDASADAKVRKLLLRHGPVGYAIYFHCLELIAGELSETNITFELEHDAEIIADNLKIKGTPDRAAIDVVNDVMRYMVELGLFENHDDRITCFKLMKRLDSSMTSSSKMRKLITDARESHDPVMTQSCKTRLDKTRLEQKRREKSRANARHPTLDVPMNQKRYDSLVAKYGAEKVDDAIEARIDWEASKGKRTSADYAHAAANWLRNDEKWDGNGSNPDFVAWDPDEYDRKKEAEREQSQRHG